MKRSGTLNVAARGEHEIVMTRVFDAPRRLVWDAYTKPELLERWLLGPDGWTLHVPVLELRVGGAYTFVWRKGDQEMRASGVYREIAPPDRLVNTERFEQPWYPGEAVITMELVEAGGRTTLTATMCYGSRDTRDAVLKSGMESGVEVSYDRLASILAEQVVQEPA